MATEHHLGFVQNAGFHPEGSFVIPAAMGNSGAAIVDDRAKISTATAGTPALGTFAPGPSLARAEARRGTGVPYAVESGETIQRRLRVNSIDAPVALPREVNWLELQENDRTPIKAAAIFDIGTPNPYFPFLNKIDYLDLSPFEEHKTPGHDVHIVLEEMAGASVFDPYRSLSSGLIRITGEVSVGENMQAILEEIEKGSKEGKIPLYLFAHGGARENKWIVGTQGGKDYVDFYTLLTQLGTVLSTGDMSNPTKLRDRYSIILLESCNARGFRIPQALIDHLGVPIAYTKKGAGVLTSPDDMELAMPTT